VERKYDIVRIRKDRLPKGSEKAVKEFTSAIKGKNIEIEETSVSLIIWENVTE
jgi:hypothetical protein